MPPRAASRTFRLLLLLASAAYFAFLCIHLSNHRMMWADEFDAWNLLADPSWHHAFASLNNGADSGPPLYYFLGRCLMAVTGLHPVAMRLYSAFCFWLAAVVWVHILRRYFGSLLAVAAVVLAFLCNPELVDQIAQVRFYGELVLAATLAVRIALWLEEKRPSARLCFAAAALAGLLLVASHPLGLLYSAAIVFAQMFTSAPKRKRAAVLAGTVLSWAYLLIFFLPVKHAAETDTWLSMPNAAAVLHFYDNHPLLFLHGRYVSVVLNLVLLCLAVYACVWFLRSRRWKSTQPNSFALLFYIAALLLLMPIAFAVLSHLYKPLFLGRYLLPYCLGLLTLAAAGTWLLAQPILERSPRRFAVLLFAPLALLVFLACKQQALNPASNLAPVLQLAQSTPVVIQDDGLIRQAHFYAPAQAENLFYIMLEPKHGERSTLYSIAQQGYEPYLVYDAPFFKQHPQFLYVDGPWQPRFFNEDLRGNPHWNFENAGAVTIRGVTYPVLRVTHVDSAAPAATRAH
ncbi:MAG TPA: hypothetical protein VIJ65_11250 [Acidobacteriaceae bacterium]